MGDKSKEFCGGTHVFNTKEISSFAIIKEGSPGAGNRRIEALCGESVVEYFLTQFQTLSAKIETHNLNVKEAFGDLKNLGISSSVFGPEEIQKMFLNSGTNAVETLRKSRGILEAELQDKSQELFKAKKKIEKESFQESPELLENLTSKIKSFPKGKVLLESFGAVDSKSLKDLCDSLKSKEPEIICLFGAKEGDTSTLVFMCNKVLVDRGIHCGNLLKEALTVLGGKGGGRPDMAQGGGKNPEDLDKALLLAEKLTIEILGG
jgi:alanyl-tRNA synthetase